MINPYFSPMFSLPRGDVFAAMAFSLLNPPIHMRATAFAAQGE